MGCVLVDPETGEIVGRGRNKTNELRNATRHAELECIDAVLAAAATHAEGCALLRRCIIYVTVEPCETRAGSRGGVDFKVFVRMCVYT